MDRLFIPHRPGYVAPIVRLTQAALIEVGRLDLADRIYMNRGFWPSYADGNTASTEDRMIVHRAMLLAYISLAPEKVDFCGQARLEHFSGCAGCVFELHQV